ncbi:Seryl-tRNA synthetase [hydrothermal vent metagenome]|uniref:Serine--tRNA ligase n=1 Tax=hydrothermal vent metagenome TaxID=652676 RepID=A0A1W1CHN5_9ZZZZ
MLDIKHLKNNLELCSKKLQKKNFDFDSDFFLSLEVKRKEYQVKLQDLQNQRNIQSKKIGELKANKEDATEVLKLVASLKIELEKVKVLEEGVKKQLEDFLMLIPNIPDDDVPAGNSEDDNVEILKWGKPKTFDFSVKDHVDLGEQLEGLDFATAAKITSARFSVMSGNIAKLHRALVQFMLDQHTKNGYTEVYVPYLVNAESLKGTGQLPKFEVDLFKTHLHGEEGQARPLYLIPTAEVPITNMVRDEIIDEKKLPLKFVSHTPCFRSEAGAYGRDTRGLIRQHQFEKVELVQVVKAEESEKTLEDLTLDAEGILQALELPYRKVILCGGDLGFSAAKTYDIEVWLPAQNTYREISSCSNFKDFQARRMTTRFKNKQTGKTELLHTLNGSGLAVGRTLIAVLENYQNADGSITVPKVLQNYMGGLEVIV